MPDASQLIALLGPTNTGKTHRAVERMLEHDSGMIGLPLRLLAREVYDRITARVGEERVALVTGEEKRVPRRPDYFVCTVEAMPMDREVDFLAVDEVQLAEHDQRGHVFTDRLLRARGRKETWFLGAQTMTRIMGELVPAAKVVQHPRLSRLSSAGATPLARLPPRSAVVAFSATQVYGLAERLRALRGGAAIVLGALSPRTRNAQVAMFQAGEVDYLVATDAIGMGLNLDVAHVAFGALRKFDGREARELDLPELAQIAGRAGRWLQNGTFGTVAPLSLPKGVTHALEHHAFPPVRRVRWRSADLDFSTIDALIASLRKPPRLRALRLQLDAEDATALAALGQMESVRAATRGEDDVALLWDVCRVPDYRRLLVDTHHVFLARIYEALTGPGGRLDADWVAPQIGELDDDRGDVDTLVARLASIRVWTYVTHQSGWLDDAATWQARTRAIEDRLGDALHARLVERFVDQTSKRRRATASSGGRGRASETDDEDLSVDRSHPFAALAALRRHAPAVAAPPAAGSDPWVEALVSAPHACFTIDAAGHVVHAAPAGEPETVARLVRGASLLLPDVRLVDMDDVGPGARARIQRRIVAFARDAVNELLAAVRSPDVRALSGSARGLAYQLELGLGTMLSDDARTQIAALDARDREGLAAGGIHVGRAVSYVSSLLRPENVSRRAALIRVHAGERALPSAPRIGAVSVAAQPNVDPRIYLCLGHPVFGGLAVRADIVERVADAIAAGERPDDVRASRWLGCRQRDAARVVDAIERALPPLGVTLP